MLKSTLYKIILSPTLFAIYVDFSGHIFLLASTNKRVIIEPNAIFIFLLKETAVYS